MDDLLIDLNLDQIQRDYPVTCLPSSLNKRSGKANKCLYEELDLKLYEPTAKMVAFHTAINRIQPWLKTLDIFYYDNLGKEGSNYSVQWEDDPINWTDRNDANNKVTIQLHTLKDWTNTLLYKITFFVTTGTIIVQGNKYSLFTEHFSTLKKILNMVLKEYGKECVTEPKTTVTADSETFTADLSVHDNASVPCDDTDLKMLHVVNTSQQSEQTQINVHTDITDIESQETVHINTINFNDRQEQHTDTDKCSSEVVDLSVHLQRLETCISYSVSKLQTSQDANTNKVLEAVKTFQEQNKSTKHTDANNNILSAQIQNLSIEKDRLKNELQCTRNNLAVVTESYKKNPCHMNKNFMT